MKVLAVIPARGGSKSIPRKNLVDVAGRPLIAWAIGAAREAKRLDRVIVSTEDEEIAETARKWGAEVPFVRPPELATGDQRGEAGGGRWGPRQTERQWFPLCPVFLSDHCVVKFESFAVVNLRRT